MLKRSNKADSGFRKGGPGRILVVDDDPDAARLLGAILRREGYEVAEVAEHSIALLTLVNEPNPIDGVVASFTNGGTAAGLKLLDAIRHHSDARISMTRVMLLMDSQRRHVYSFQSGVDEVVLRPTHESQIVEAVRALVTRADSERAAHRRRMIDYLNETHHSDAVESDQSSALTVPRFS